MQKSIKLQMNNGKEQDFIVNVSEDGRKFRIALDTVWHDVEHCNTLILVNDDLAYSVCKVISESFAITWPNNPEYHIAGIVLDNIIPDYDSVIFDGTAKLNETTTTEIWADKKVYKKLNNDCFEFQFCAENNPFKKSSNLHGVTMYRTNEDSAVWYELN